MKRLYILFFIFLIGFCIGNDYQLYRIEQRAVNIGSKDCYDNQDVEVIVFGEIQE